MTYTCWILKPLISYQQVCWHRYYQSYCKRQPLHRQAGTKLFLSSITLTTISHILCSFNKSEVTVCTLITSMSITRGSVTWAFFMNISRTLFRPCFTVMSSWYRCTMRNTTPTAVIHVVLHLFQQQRSTQPLKSLHCHSYGFTNVTKAVPTLSPRGRPRVPHPPVLGTSRYQARYSSLTRRFASPRSRLKIGFTAADTTPLPATAILMSRPPSPPPAGTHRARQFLPLARWAASPAFRAGRLLPLAGRKKRQPPNHRARGLAADGRAYTRPASWGRGCAPPLRARSSLRAGLELWFGARHLFPLPRNGAIACCSVRQVDFLSVTLACWKRHSYFSCTHVLSK